MTEKVPAAELNQPESLENSENKVEIATSTEEENPAAEMTDESVELPESLDIKESIEEPVIPDPDHSIEEIASLEERSGVDEISLKEDIPTSIEMPDPEKVELIEEILPVMQETVLEEMPENEELPVLAEMPVDEEMPVAEEIPALAEAPVDEENPVAEEIPALAEAPVDKENPVAEELPVAAGVPVEEELVTAEKSVTEQKSSLVAKPEKIVIPKVATESDSDAMILHEITEIDDHAEHEEEEDEELMEEQEVILENYDAYDREKLVEILEETVKEENVQRIKTRVAMIKVAFLKLSKDFRQLKLDEHLQAGGTRENYLPEQDVLIEKFNKVFETYKKNKFRYNEQQEVIKLRNLDAKKQILEELKDLISSDESLKKTYDSFKELQTKWKEIGLVPSTEINNLWQNYHFLVEKFFDKVKISKELRDLDLKKNLEKKIELCEKAEELLIEPSVTKSFQQLQKYHEEWKEIGPVPQDKRDEVWERFKTATDKINERRRDHYNLLVEDQEKNLQAKTSLCERAEQIASMEIESLKDWQDRTREVNDLFKEWKTLGPAPKKDNDEVWEKFRTFLNAFFANKKEFFSRIKQEQLNNFNLKLDLVRQAEALKESTDWRKTTQELINLQKEWRNIGPVPRKHSDKIWKRFRAACDDFFSNKSKFFSTVVESEKENLDKKLDLIRRIEEWKAGKDKSANLETLKSFQREFMEIGHVPIKDKNKVHDSFRQAINKHLDELHINSNEIRMNAEYRPRYESAHDDSGDGRYQRRGDSGGLSVKITKLREEILLWENNIGFLAHSKKADLLRQEFELKIQKAKEELAGYEAKLKNMQE